jgi:hypothetical protein
MAPPILKKTYISPKITMFTKLLKCNEIETKSESAGNFHFKGIFKKILGLLRASA